MPLSPEKLAAARHLYLRFGGLHHRLIESMMRRLGYKSFTRRVFYDRRRNGRPVPGWITKYDWKRELERSLHPACSSSLPNSPNPTLASSASVRTRIAGDIACLNPPTLSNPKSKIPNPKSKIGINHQPRTTNHHPARSSGSFSDLKVFHPSAIPIEWQQNCLRIR